MAAVWLLFYGLNAYWLTAVHKPRRSLRKQLVLPKLSPTREYQTAQVTASSSSSGAIAVNNFDNFDQFRLDKSFASNFSNYLLAVDTSEHYVV
ncbi:MAG: glucosyltransferase, partial [Pseudanabaena sp.]